MIVKLNIEDLLIKNNKKIRDIEKMTWISYQALWSMKKGKTTKISFETIGRLLKAFKCKPNDLFTITK